VEALPQQLHGLLIASNSPIITSVQGAEQNGQVGRGFVIRQAYSVKQVAGGQS
jgi:hypothetical protein